MLWVEGSAPMCILMRYHPMITHFYISANTSRITFSLLIFRTQFRDPQFFQNCDYCDYIRWNQNKVNWCIIENNHNFERTVYQSYNCKNEQILADLESCLIFLNYSLKNHSKVQTCHHVFLATLKQQCKFRVQIHVVAKVHVLYRRSA